MTVKELITDLLEYGMEDDVKVKVNLSTDYQELDMEIDYSPRLHEILLTVDLSRYELIEKDRLEELESIEGQYEIDNLL